MKTYKEQEVLQLFSVLTQRALLSAQLGTQSYGGDRDIYEALGYKKDITFDDYYNRYSRQDIAKAVIDRPIKATWRGDIKVIESTDDEQTSLEKEFDELQKKLKLKTRFIQLDKLTGLHKYGVMLLGFSDVQVNEEFANPVEGKVTLEYVKSFSDNTATIQKYDNDPKSERYGLPELYQLGLVDASGSSSSILVHYSRILHVCDDTLESDIEGTPRLQAIFNRLMDLQKIVGGDAEMFWRGARPGYAGSLKEGYQMTTETLEGLQSQIDEFEHNLRRILINEGIDLKALAQQIADPSNHFDIQITLISAVTGIPKRILTGSERGELASSQDQNEWLNYVKGRREEFAEPEIIRAFVDKCIEYKVLPEPKEDYTIEWEDLFSMGDKDKAELGKIKASALREYASNPAAEMILPQEAFLQYLMGFNEDQIEMIGEMQKAIDTEQDLTDDELDV